jgi:cytoskeletal protein RodZ
MGRFGEKLKAAREERGVTLDAIASKTRVSVRLLAAIESERFDLLPGGVFNISFIRQYCRAVGLEEEEIVAEFNQLARPAELEVTETVEAPDERVLMQERGATLAENVTDYLRRYGRVTAAAVAVLFVVAALAWLYPGDSGANPEPASNASSVAQPRAAVEDVPAVSEPGAAGRETAAASPDVEAEPGPPLLAGAASGLASDAGAGGEDAPAITSASDPAKPLHVEISITAKVWVQAVADGERVFEDILEPGATRSIEASDSVRLVVGNAAGVTVALNGKVLPPIGPSGHVRRVVLTSSGMEIDRVEPNRPPGETASDAPFETRNGSRGSVPALAIAKPDR